MRRLRILVALAVAVLAVFVVRCSAQSSAAVLMREVPWTGKGVWLAADTHVHTKFSDGIGTPAEAAAKARSFGCDVLGIADHGGDSEAIGQLAAEHRVRIRVRAAHVVIEMGEAREHQVSAGREVAQQKRERRRIRSAGHAGHDARLRRPQRMPRRILPDPVEKTLQLETLNFKLLTLMVPEGGLEPPTLRL